MTSHQPWTEHQVEVADIPYEFMLNYLRLNRFLPKALFQDRTGLDWQVLMPALIMGVHKTCYLLMIRVWL